MKNNISIGLLIEKRSSLSKTLIRKIKDCDKICASDHHKNWHLLESSKELTNNTLMSLTSSLHIFEIIKMGYLDIPRHIKCQLTGILAVN